MSDPIHIDLRNLTREKLAECKPHLGKWRYSAPCVLGTLMPEDKRGRLDREPVTAIVVLLGVGTVTMPEDQLDDACDLQCAFDLRDWHAVERIAAKWMDQAVSK